jgi:hypothetical protein
MGNLAVISRSADGERTSLFIRQNGEQGLAP